MTENAIVLRHIGHFDDAFVLRREDFLSLCTYSTDCRIKPPPETQEVLDWSERKGDVLLDAERIIRLGAWLRTIEPEANTRLREPWAVLKTWTERILED